MDRIPLTRPETDESEVEEVAAVLASGFLTQGPKVAELEEQVARLVTARNAVATTSATTALHLSLAALDIGPGDEVLIPDFTFPATANVVIQQRAKPIFVDIDPVTYAIDPGDLSRRITPRCKAIMPVHPFGAAADMGAVMALAQDEGLLVVEDAACALGATFGQQRVGPIGTAGCFSFHPRKSITTGEGGMVVTNDDDLADRLRLLRSHGGRRIRGRFEFERAGYNYRLSDILAAVGVAQLRKLTDLLGRRRALAERYRQLLADTDLQLPADPPWGRHVFQSYVVRLPDSADRDGAIQRLAEEGIETTIGTYALHREPYFARALGYAPGDLPNSTIAFRHTLTLPLYPSMSAEDQEYVADRLRLAVRGR